MKNPNQPLVLDSAGILRFKSNAIVSYLLAAGGIDMNGLAQLDFTDNDWQQFAQLTGYSLAGYCDLPYVDAEAIDTVQLMARLSQPGAEVQR